MIDSFQKIAVVKEELSETQEAIIDEEIMSTSRRQD